MRGIGLRWSACIAGILAAFVLATAPAGAQQLPVSKCAAGKDKCVAKKLGSVLKCHVTSETKGVAVNDKECLDKAKAKYDGGADQTKGCIAKLDAKYPPGSETPCLTFGDTKSLEDIVDPFVDASVHAVDPAYPAVVVNKCAANKKKCISTYAAGRLKCYQTSFTKGVPPNDKGCLDKATAKFDGGAEPTKGCFEKLEDKGSCPTHDDTVEHEMAAVQFVSDVVTALTAAGPTTTSTSSTTTTTGGATTTTTGGGTTSTTGGATTTTTTSASTTTTLVSTLTCGPSGVVARLAVSWDPRQIAAVATWRLDLRYPATVSIPGSLLETDDSRFMIITGIDGTTTFVDRDDDSNGVDDTLRILYAVTGGRSFPPGDMAEILFDCTPSAQISTSAFSCLVLDAADPIGTSIPNPQSIPCGISGLRLP